ncbi:30S ribosome-binding factor RbfA [Brevibacterium litoralis]|uniref:30S ribosome-binding factor RbfA n=1 Tax=Brevibacterium litoralis TaxID=3138935 RepID=UPI0032EF990D
MADPTRARKIADRIQVIVARTLERRVKDPRLGFITVTEVRVTGDLQNATVFYTVFGDEEQHAATAAALQSSAGLIRSEVGKGLQIRLTPTLEFVADSVPQAAAELDAKLAEAARRDAEVAALAEGAAPAGEADPYRKPRDHQDDTSGS